MNLAERNLRRFRLVRDFNIFNSSRNVGGIEEEEVQQD